MSNGEIRSFQDLLDEEQRVSMEYKQNKANLVDAVNRLMNILKPAEQLVSKVSKWFSVPPSQYLFPRIVDIALDFVSKRFLFKNSGWLKSFLGSYAIRTASQFIMGNKHQFKQRKAHEGTDETLNQ